MSPILGIFASAVSVATTSFESIATATGTGSSGTITLSSIPGTFAHLQLRLIGKRSAMSDVAYYIRLNSDTGSNYDYHYLRGRLGGATAGVINNESYIQLGGTPNSSANTNVHTVTVLDILDYTNTNKYTTVRLLSGCDQNISSSSDTYVWFGSGLWRNTNAITSISVILDSGNWSTTTQVALYGIKAA